MQEGIGEKLKQKRKLIIEEEDKIHKKYSYL